MKWIVSIPIAGYVNVTVEADDEESAIESALEGEVDILQLEDWRSMRHIAEGGICYAPIRSADAEPF